MPHLVIEHSSNIKKSAILALQTGVQEIMLSIPEGNFDPDQCKCRSHSFDEYLVGRPNQTTSSFLHVTIKILSGRSIEVQKKLAAKTAELSQKIFNELALTTTRCDISVDIVEMNRDTYQKIRIGA